MKPRDQLSMAFYSKPVCRRTRSQHNRFTQAWCRNEWPTNIQASSSRVSQGGFESGKKKQKRRFVVASEESQDEEDESSQSEGETDDVIEIIEEEASDDDDDIVEVTEKNKEEDFVASAGLETTPKKVDTERDEEVISLDSSSDEDSAQGSSSESESGSETEDSEWVEEDSDGSTWKKYKKRRVGGSGVQVKKQTSKKRHVSSSSEEEDREELSYDVKRTKRRLKFARVVGKKSTKLLKKKRYAVSSSEDDHVKVWSDEERSSKKGLKRKKVGRPAKKDVKVSSSEDGTDSEEEWSDEDTDVDAANGDDGSSEDVLYIPIPVKKDGVPTKLNIEKPQETGLQSRSFLKSKIETSKHKIKKIDHSSQVADNVDDGNNEADDNFENCINNEDGVGEDDLDGGNKEEVVGKKGVSEDSTKRERVHVPKGVSLFKLFVSTIWEKGGKLQEEEPVPQVEKTNPYKFNFGVEVPKPVLKTAQQKILDKIWEDFDFYEKSTEIGSIGSQAEDLNKPQVRKDPSCSENEHDFILDEQIGILCRFCRFVKTEIRYILPSVDSSIAYDRSPKKKYAKDEEISMWEGFSFDDAGGNSQGSYGDFEGTVWDMFPRIRENLYPHQQEGFEFLWRNIAGGIDIEELKSPTHSDDIGGCVISHAPGTGKTLLTIVFIQSYMEVFKGSRAIIMAPCSMLLTWEEEFKKWKAKVPFHNLNSSDFSGMEDKVARELINGKTEVTKWTRLVKILSWSKGNSVLGISYPLFEKLVGERPMKDTDIREHTNEANELRKILLEKPNLLVFDEGHTPRNKRSLIWKALEKIKTEKRIILSGTPFQNNFEELYNTLSLVRPKFLDSIASSKTRKKEARGKWASLTSSIGKDTDDRLVEKIRTMMAPFVHVHKGSILRDNLPGLRDCMVVLEPPSLQMDLLKEVKQVQNQNGFELEHAVSLVSIHPSLLTKCSCSKNEKSLVEEITSKGFNLDEIKSKEFRFDPSKGVKTRFLMELIPLTEAKKEKVLVFSQYIDPFSLIKEQLHHHFNWTEGEEVLQINGRKNMKHRQMMINTFNDPCSKARILLASTRACREGINLVGASRIVLLDVVWNPSVERQAISRAYRIGQKKVVYTYHLITSETIEGEKYRKQVSKDRLSELVFTSAQTHDDKPKSSLVIQDDTILDEMVGSEKLKHIFKEIVYQPKESHLVDSYF